MAKKIAEYQAQIRKQISKDPKESRPERILIIVQAETSAQKEEIRAAAKKANMSMSAFMVQAAMEAVKA
jgi:uncharacterized protein (DUF1778 family)